LLSQVKGQLGDRGPAGVDGERVPAVGELLQLGDRAGVPGIANREIGERLFVSHRTVGSHLYRMFPKLGISSRAELLQLAAARQRA
jgi:hypothetical protein